MFYPWCFIHCETGECILRPCLGDFLNKVEIKVHSDGGIYIVDLKRSTLEFSAMADFHYYLMPFHP